MQFGSLTASLRTKFAEFRETAVFPLMLLVAAYYFFQGMGGNPGLHRQALEDYLKNTLELSTTGQAEFLFFITIPWMVKPLYGMLTDSIPIFGYRRVSYFLLAGALSMGAYVLIALFGYSYMAVLLLYVLALLGFAMSDVLCDAVMVEKGKPLQAVDRLQSAQWAAIAFAGISLTFFGGFVAEYLAFQQAVLISVIFPALVILITLFFLKEERQHSVSNAASNAWRGIKEAVRLPQIWGCFLFIFLFNLSPNIGTALYNYQQDTLGFNQVDIGYLRSMMEVGFFSGAVIFGFMCRRFSETVLLNSIVWLGVLSTLMFLLYSSFWAAFYIEFFAGFIGVMVMLGILTLAARVCPQNAEGTVFALLMSVFNFGKEISNVIGGFLYDSLCYDWLIIISAGFTACMWFFLPLVRQKPIGKTYIIVSCLLGILAIFGFIFREQIFS